MLRDSINSIFKQIEIEKTKECDEMQSRIKIKLTPLKSKFILKKDAKI